MGQSLCREEEETKEETATSNAISPSHNSVPKEDWIEVEGNKPNPHWRGLKRISTQHIPTHSEAVDAAVEIAKMHLQIA